MIICNENENNIDKKIMDTNPQKIAYFGKILSISNNQHLSNIWDSIH